MAYLDLMLSRSPLLKTLNHLHHKIVLVFLIIYAPAQEIKTQQGMKLKLSYSEATYLTDQGMLS